MDFRHFPIDRYLRMREEHAAFFSAFYSPGGPRVAVSQRPGYRFTGPVCRYADRQLENELEYIALCMNYRSDIMNMALEPWLGVGIYAAGFGAKYIWTDTAAPQTRPFVDTPEEAAALKLKPLSEWEEMTEVLRRIRYFKQQTNGLVGITLTDTQSPNDTASLIMNTSEFFADCIDAPDEIEPLLSKVTDAIIEYSRIQMEEIGDQLCMPGHNTFSGPDSRVGIMVSCDNMAVISPRAFKNAEAEYLERLARAFGGVSTHSCGRIIHNLDCLTEVKGLVMADCAADGDPNPNDPVLMAEKCRGRDGVIFQVRANVHKLDRLKPLIDSGAKLHILLGPDPDPLVSNRLVDSFKDKYL
ncbi:MAG: uroporphyrinogen decarboxylase family protein [Clostridiales bacterium]|nr:uroporphyrinogen decarboxylase family protein [Clostridiales bacterium]